MVCIRASLWISGDGALKKGGAMKDGDREVLIALDGHRAGKSMREMPRTRTTAASESPAAPVQRHRT